MASMTTRMLDQAAELIEQHPRSSAAKRRAVSAAYYAAFHELLQTCARVVLPAEAAESEVFERVYRSLDHGSMKTAFQANGPLKSVPALSAIGIDLVQLQAARIKADYTPPRPRVFELSEAKEHVERARKIVSGLSNLSQDDQKTLAIHLLFSVRKK